MNRKARLAGSVENDPKPTSNRAIRVWQTGDIRHFLSITLVGAGERRGAKYLVRRGIRHCASKRGGEE